MGALPFIAAGFFNILHLLQKAYSQLPIQHQSNPFEKCPPFGRQSPRLQCLLHVNIYPQPRKANAKAQAPSKALLGEDGGVAIIDTYNHLKLHFNITSVPHSQWLHLGL